MRSSVLILVCAFMISGCNMVNEPKTYKPAETNLPANEKYILTQKESPKPRINCAKVFGVRPGNPFLFTIAATGTRPITFEAKGLPDGLKLDIKTGQITGKVEKSGTHIVTLKASNSLGFTEQTLKIVVGEIISLTPAMGWNSWNCWSGNVTEQNVRASAKAMVDSGLINHGWTYINIDDGWQGKRGGELNAIQPNEKFPDMKGLCEDVHSFGLKIGIYSTPWVTSYSGRVGGSSDNEDGTWIKIDGYEKYIKNHRHGKYKFDTNDAKQWARWGFDYLKYDWKPNDQLCTKRMADALRASGRDFVFSLSNTAPFKEAAVWACLANSWRTTNDIRDAWSRTQLPKDESWSLGIIDIWQIHNKWAAFNGPGHYNDADMLVVGNVGWGKPHPTRLTPDEQYSHISLWCLWSSPLLLGCPLDRLDKFTLNLLTNDEVLAINQDPLAEQAREIPVTGKGKVLVKNLEDGSKAVGLFNIGAEPNAVKITWEQLGISNRQAVRDLWRQKDIGEYKDSFEAIVRPHGVILTKISPAGK